ncbi:nuclease-related domain-containing protein [Neobacillus sp. FSL H8-0543]|uniref:nuclease-related domain-containing protein n=1 Tax=Neobacillus sp. FSL H8-0543 TaxID=2954672 RepID=UPI0031580B75
MIIRPRKESEELLILRILNTRRCLGEDDKRHYLVCEKGFEGEEKFDLLLEKLQNENLTLNALLLEFNKSHFQIDTLIIFQRTIYLIDVKNYEGEYFFKTDGFYYANGKPMKDSLAQLKRCELLLSQLIQKYGFNYPIESYLIFINPEFTLYHAPENPQIILPTQINRFMNKLNMIPSKLTDRHLKLAKLLDSLHQDKNPFAANLAYDFDYLQKWFNCVSCNSFKLIAGRTKLICDTCGCEEEIELAILRCVEEIKLLFPDKRITTSCVFDWCGGIVSEKTIRRVLNSSFEMINKKRFAHYK